MIPKEFLNSLKRNDYFLDYVTGDIYEFRKVEIFNMQNTSDWIPVMNIGLHNEKMAEKFSKIYQ